jgi:hypothetical protein
MEGRVVPVAVLKYFKIIMQQIPIGERTASRVLDLERQLEGLLAQGTLIGRCGFRRRAPPRGWGPSLD